MTEVGSEAWHLCLQIISCAVLTLCWVYPALHADILIIEKCFVQDYTGLTWPVAHWSWCGFLLSHPCPFLAAPAPTVPWPSYEAQTKQSGQDIRARRYQEQEGLSSS
jgi:hypothetical protein